MFLQCLRRVVVVLLKCNGGGGRNRTPVSRLMRDLFGRDLLALYLHFFVSACKSMVARTGIEPVFVINWSLLIINNLHKYKTSQRNKEILPGREVCAVGKP